jgi:hypothetical protein
VGHPKAEVVKSAHFLFLDMKMTWSEEGDLRFGVYLKPGQELKYLNSDSLHPPHCFKAITKGVFGRLASLTSLTDKIAVQILEGLVPTTSQGTGIRGPSTQVRPHTSSSTRFE